MADGLGENTKLAQLRYGYREAEAYRFGPPGVPRLFVGFVYNPSLAGAGWWNFSASLLKLQQSLRYRTTILGIPSGPNISNPRNDVGATFLQTDDEWFLSLDTDIQFEPDHVDMLIAHGLDIVGGTYCNKFGVDEKPIPVCSVSLGEGKFGHGDVIQIDRGLVKVFGLGMGFTLVRREVMEKLGNGPLWPFAELAVTGANLGAIEEADRNVVHMLSEDITFCARAQALGYEVWMDLDCKVKHHKSTVY